MYATTPRFRRSVSLAGPRGAPLEDEETHFHKTAGMLRVFTLLTAAVHAAGGAITIVVGQRRDQHFATYVSYMKWPEEAGKSFEFVRVKATTLSLMGLVASFFFLSFAFQFFPAAYTPLWQNTLERLTTKGIQPYRWVEYSASASCLLLVAAALGGIDDLHFLLLIFGSTWAVMMLGWIQENTAYYIRAATRKSAPHKAIGLVEFVAPHLVGWVPYIMVWFALFHKFQLASHGAHLPAWLNLVYVFNIVVFSCFGVNQAWQMARLYGRPEAAELKHIALQHEFVYVFLSLAAKSVTAYFLLSGMLASSKYGTIDHVIRAANATYTEYKGLSNSKFRVQ